MRVIKIRSLYYIYGTGIFFYAEVESRCVEEEIYRAADVSFGDWGVYCACFSCVACAVGAWDADRCSRINADLLKF